MVNFQAEPGEVLVGIDPISPEFHHGGHRVVRTLNGRYGGLHPTRLQGDDRLGIIILGAAIGICKKVASMPRQLMNGRHRPLNFIAAFLGRKATQDSVGVGVCPEVNESGSGHSRNRLATKHAER